METITNTDFQHHVLNALFDADFWEDLRDGDPTAVTASERLTEAEAPLIAGHSVEESDALTSAIWGLIAAHEKLAFLYGYRVCTALGANPSPTAPCAKEGRA